jgi:hypothetical protein
MLKEFLVTVGVLVLALFIGMAVGYLVSSIILLVAGL